MRITKEGFETENIIADLFSVCDVDTDVTLKDIIFFTHANPFLEQIVEVYAGCNVLPFYEEVQKPCAIKSTLHYIEISRSITLKRGFKSAPAECTITCDVHGVGPDENGTGDIVDNWGIDFTPVSEMAELPIRLAATIAIQDTRTDKFTTETFGNRSNGFTLIEILGEIFFEIGFHGSPKARNERLGEVLDAIKSIKDGTAKLSSWEELKKELDDNDPTIQ